jgi:hypothetical protein
MGLMRFQVYPRQKLTEVLVSQAYLSGIDRVAWPVRNSVENGELYIQRAVSDSACLQIPWTVEGHGQLTLSTGTLIERPIPYMLPLEIARGTVNLVRTQLFEWQSIGLLAPEELLAKIAEATGQLAAAVVEQNNSPVCAELSEKSLRIALDAANALAACYVEQAGIVRRRNAEKRPIHLGGDLGSTLLDTRSARQFMMTFNGVNVPLCWREIEINEGQFDWSIADTQIQFAKQNGKTITAGPLLLLDSRAWPDWIALWEDDFESQMEFAARFIRQAVERYRGQVDFWIAAGRVNTAEMLSLGEEEKLRLTALALEILIELDPERPAIVGFDQPWAEYMSRRNVDFPPLHFADALIRSGLSVAGINLEFNVGYHPGGTLNRNPLDFSRQLDHWTYFGLPLWISLCVPSGHSEDPAAHRKNLSLSDGWTPEAQQAWITRYLPIMMAKPAVQGIFWNQLTDAAPHDFPHGGLFDDQGQAKPALKTLRTLRREREAE